MELIGERADMELLKFATLVIIIMAALLIVSVLLTGCQQGIYEVDGTEKRVKFNTLFMHLDFSKLKWNDLEIDDYDADAQEVDVITPYGGLKTE